MTIKDRICFTANSFDRLSLKRLDDDWLSKQLADDSSLFLLFWNNRFLISDQSNLHFLSKTTAEKYSRTDIEWKFLGRLDRSVNNPGSSTTLFGAEITDATESAEQATWSSLRSIGLKLPPEEANLLAYTQGLLNWHSVNHYCSICGSRLQSKQAGHALVCSDANCGKEIFPRTDPAIIVLVHNQDSCLLARQASWPDKMYSCLAGFIETGEDIETAVRREIYEESGLELSEIKYRGSQPWPFPQSLMLGFHAEATGKTLTFHDGEIHDAHWFSRQQIIDAITNQQLRLPSSISISYDLIEDWFNQQHKIPLTRFLDR